MSWDEKDWAYTWVTGKKERLNLLFRRFVFDEKDETVEICCTFYSCSRGLNELNDEDLRIMETIAKSYGVMIEYQYLGSHRYCFDYKNKEPRYIDLTTSCPLKLLSEPLGRQQYKGCSSYQFNAESNLYLYKYSKNFTESEFMADLTTVESFLLNIQKKLSNEKFVNNVPAAVIELERKKQADAESIIKSLKESIAALKKA